MGRLSTMLAIALLVFVWVGTALYLELDRKKTAQAAAGNSANIARIFEDHVSRSIKEIDKTLLFIRHAWEADPENFDFPAWTTNTYLLRDLTVQMALIGPDGRLIATNVDRRAEPLDLADREHFRVHADRNTDELFISKPVLGRATGKWTIQLTRRLARSDGTFAGVLVASLDPYHLSKIFEDIDLGREGAITLFGTDGVIRARGGLNAAILGRSIVDTPLYAEMKARSIGMFFGPGTISGGTRLVAWRRIKEFPLVVAVGVDEKDFMADYQDRRDLFIDIAAGLSLVILAVMLLGVRHEMRLARARAVQSESERRIAVKSQELEATLFGMNQGIVMLDADGRLRVINRRAIELLSTICDAPTRGEPLPDVVASLLASAEEMEARREIAMPDGTDIECETTVMPDGGTLHTLTDITEPKRIQANLADARDRAEAASRARTAFLATMSHELRTPLNGVVGMTTLLSDCSDAGEREEYLDTIRRSAESLLRIIEDVLDVTRLEADGIAFDYSPFDPAATLHSAVELVAEAARRKNLDLEVTIEPDVPRAVLGDADRLRQALLHLLGNAVKFTETGGVTVHLSLVDRHPGDTLRLAFRIEDTGIGIAPENLPLLFQDFAQLDGSLTRRFGGTGLGLALSRRLAEKFGGSIEVASVPERGSVFTLVVPAPVATPDTLSTSEAEASAPVDRAPPSPEELPPDLAILLVEDNPTNTLVASRLLQNLGHRVTSVGDGLAALEALRERLFDVVLMDVMMPRMDGLTAMRAIRAGETARADLPIVAISANALKEDRAAAIAAGADAFASKPVTAESLTSAIREAFSRPSPRDPDDGRLRRAG